MTTFRVAYVDVYVLRGGAGGARDAGAAAGAAGPMSRRLGSGARQHRNGRAARRVRRSVRCARRPASLPARLYNLSRVESFYRHAIDEVGFIPVFAAFMDAAPVTLSAEHDAAEWLSLPAAQGRLAWPRERRALEDIVVVLGQGQTPARWKTC